MTKINHKKLGIGIVGCGNISLAYLNNAPLFAGVEVRACADIYMDAAKQCAQEFGVRALGVDELMRDSEIDLVLNLTIPTAHFDVSMQALSEGKHVFTEKPLATSAKSGRIIVDEAAKRGLAVGSAPDTFLGAAGRYARRLMETGAIGRVVTGTAFMMGRGMEHAHPNPSFYYQPGGGPVLDMGPYYLTMLVNLLGPISRVQAVSSTGQSERLITADGPNNGTSFKVGTPTSILSLLEFKSGANISFGTSWDVFRHSNHPIELHGTEGSLRLPDPDNFGGVVGFSKLGAVWQEIDTASHICGAPNWPLDAPDRANYRMLGLSDLAAGITSGHSARASGELALHVLEVMEAILLAGETGVAQTIIGTVQQPKELKEAELRALLDA